MQKKPLRIANASGYWGDDPNALRRQLEGGPLDYITMDFLAEVTMSILQKQRTRDPLAGYARDFTKMLDPILPLLLEKKVKLITNAGGINPQACAHMVEQLARKHGVSVRIALVYGDSIVGELPRLQDQGVSFRNMETGANFGDVADRIEVANVYFGAVPVAEALRKWDPDIILTGRVTDTGITLAPMIHHFGWDLKDWNRLASGIVAGHIIECGSQCTGGNFTDWRKVASFDQIGYPIVEMHEDGSFFVTKHPETGGLVSVDTVREQIFYEMGDPHAYISPDVVADFTSIQLEAAGTDRVRVFGIRGVAPTDSYKVSMAYEDGFTCVGSLLVSGPEAREKAEKFAEIFWNRVEGPFLETSTEFFGWNACHRSLGHTHEGSEIMLRLGARAQQTDVLQRFSKLIPSLILGGPPGVAAVAGVAKPQAIVRYWPALLPKHWVTPIVAHFQDGSLQEEILVSGTEKGSFTAIPHAVQIAEAPSKPLGLSFEKSGTHTILLSKLCLARSGDKGDVANIGVCARRPELYPFLQEYLTAQRVKDWFQELCLGKVIRYEVEPLCGFNFLLEESLGGGGSCTLRSDAQGKTFAQALLRQSVPLPTALQHWVEAP